MKTAIVHDWLTGMRGGEKCLEVFCRLYPEADLFTLLYFPGKVSPVIENRRIRVSFLQQFPLVEKKYRYYLPLMPLAAANLDVRDYDLILSSSHCVAKGVQPGRKSLHICYCHTPMRYIWDQYDQYFGRNSSNWLTSTAMNLIAPQLRKWDVRTSSRVTHFISNSRHVQKRIKKYYGRDSTVIYPPVDTRLFTPVEPVERGDYFLVVSAFAPYKRVDLAVEAFNKLGYSLTVVGEGQESGSLHKIAGANTRFQGWLSDADVRSCYARCRAFIFCGEEDFGITPLEAQAMGRPVIAFGRGGALETVIPDRESWKPETGISEDKTANPTGVFFYEQTPDALISAIRHFESIEHKFDPRKIRDNALQFDVEMFSNRIRGFIEERLAEHQC